MIKTRELQDYQIDKIMVYQNNYCTLYFRAAN